jgi:hypothetical protein
MILLTLFAGRRMSHDIADTVWLCGQQIHIYSKATNVITADECRGLFETLVYALCPACGISCDVSSVLTLGLQAAAAGGGGLQFPQLCNCHVSLKNTPKGTFVCV